MIRFKLVSIWVVVIVAFSCNFSKKTKDNPVCCIRFEYEGLNSFHPRTFVFSNSCNKGNICFLKPDDFEGDFLVKISELDDRTFSSILEIIQKAELDSRIPLRSTGGYVLYLYSEAYEVERFLLSDFTLFMNLFKEILTKVEGEELDVLLEIQREFHENQFYVE